MSENTTNKGTSSATNISYTGSVKISLCRGNKVIRVIQNHNAGTAWLFKVLASSLCGNNESRNMPRYLDVGTGTDGHFVSALATRPALTGKYINPTYATVTVSGVDTSLIDGYEVFYTAFIPYSSLLNTTGINTLQLYSSYAGADTLLAQVNLSDAVTIDSNSYNLMVEWVMAIKNAD